MNTQSHQPSKSNDEIVEEFEQDFPPFRGVGARHPMFAETPVYTHITQWITRALEAKDAEREKAVKEERERIYNQIYHSLPTGEVTAWDWVLWSQKMLEALTPPEVNNN